MRELPNADDRAQDEQAVDESLEKTAFLFFRLHEHRVGRFPNWLEGVVCFHKIALS
jgi:hypothetical protein